MNFKLAKQSATKSLLKFQILDSAGAIVGSVNVPPSQEADLLKHWHPQAAATPAKAEDKGREAIVAALKKGPRLKREALLRS